MTSPSSINFVHLAASAPTRLLGRPPPTDPKPYPVFGPQNKGHIPAQWEACQACSFGSSFGFSLRFRRHGTSKDNHARKRQLHRTILSVRPKLLHVLSSGLSVHCGAVWLPRSFPCTHSHTLPHSLTHSAIRNSESFNGKLRS